MDGVPTLLSRDTGPAVIGFYDGTIVLPRWVLTMGDAERRLVLAHEEEHLRAGDAHLLGLALGALVLMPWNAPLWWQVRRLRHAIELDCDARVIARYPDAKAYGALLIEIGERASGCGVAYAAFSSSPFLERRIKTMFQRKPRGWKALAGISAAFAILLVAFACEVPLPTMTEPAPTFGAERGPTEAAQGTGSLAPDGPRSSMVPGTPDTLVVYLSDAVMKLRVRASEEDGVAERAPAVCGFPHGDMGWLMWQLRRRARSYAEDQSVLPAKVYPVVQRMVVDGPAWRAGLRNGDVILSIDGHDARLLVGPFFNLRDRRELSPDAPYRVRIRRGAEEHEFEFPVHFSW